MSATSSRSSEEWRPIKDFEGLYEVSNMGRIRSIERSVTYSSGRTIHWKGKILSQKQSNNGYLKVGLFKDGKGYNLYTHRIVATMFVDNPDSKKYVDHINCERKDNRSANLKWCTVSENINNPITIKRMMDAGNKTSILQISKDGVVIKEFESINEASRETGICRTSISSTCLGKQRTAGGYLWRKGNPATE